jgi:hypothetical protein
MQMGWCVLIAWCGGTHGWVENLGCWEVGCSRVEVRGCGCGLGFFRRGRSAVFVSSGFLGLLPRGLCVVDGFRGVSCGYLGSWVWVFGQLGVGVWAVGCGCLGSWVWVFGQLGGGVCGYLGSWGWGGGLCGCLGSWGGFGVCGVVWRG